MYDYAVKCYLSLHMIWQYSLAVKKGEGNSETAVFRTKNYLESGVRVDLHVLSFLYIV